MNCQIVYLWWIWPWRNLDVDVLLLVFAVYFFFFSDRYYYYRCLGLLGEGVDVAREWGPPTVVSTYHTTIVVYVHVEFFVYFIFRYIFFFCFVLIGIRWPPCRGIRAHVRTCRSRARARLDVPARFTFTFVPVIVAHRVALVYTNWPCLIVIPWLCNHLSLWPYRYVLAYTNLYKRFIYIYIYKQRVYIYIYVALYINTHVHKYML